jgi:SLT domain-containing protein
MAEEEAGHNDQPLQFWLSNAMFCGANKGTRTLDLLFTKPLA